LESNQNATGVKLLKVRQNNQFEPKHAQQNTRIVFRWLHFIGAISGYGKHSLTRKSLFLPRFVIKIDT